MTTFTTGNDTYTVPAGPGTYDLDFLAGDDRLNVFGGDMTTAHMGDGNDLIELKLGLATVYGDAGADRFDVWSPGAIIDGGADNDTVNIRDNTALTAHGGLGADRFNFYSAAIGVTLYGDDGNDDFFGYGHTISGSVYGGVGNDYFVGFGNYEGQVVSLFGGVGNDIYRADPSNPATFVENVAEGTDSVQVARGVDYTLPANIENLSVQGFSGGSSGTAATLTGNASNNSIVTHNNAETIFGLDGNDHISAKGGDDTLYGGNGNDYLDGGTGNDTIFGGAGNDTLQGRSGDEWMGGGTGDDTYYVDSLSDQVIELSGEGTDTVRVSVNGYTLSVNVENGIVQNTGSGLTLYGNGLDNQLTGNIGNDGLWGDAGNDTIKGGNGDDFLDGSLGADTLYGGSGNDTEYGDEGNDVVYGNDGDDTLYGYSGNDTIDGGAGSDWILGHYDADTLTGGAGIDLFVYWGIDDSAPGAMDHITDFYSLAGDENDDQLDLSSVDANTNVGGDQAFALAYETPTAYSLWYTYVNNIDGTQDVTFYGDVNGDTTADIAIAVHATAGIVYFEDITF